MTITSTNKAHGVELFEKQTKVCTSQRLTNATFWDPNGHFLGDAKVCASIVNSGPKKDQKENRYRMEE